MIDWTARAKTQILQTAATPTAKTDETRLSSVSAVPTWAVCERREGLSSVSSVVGGAVSEKREGLSSVLSVVGGAVSEKRDFLQPTKNCTACRHLTRVKTCAAPVAAGLLPTFGIVWPPQGHGAACPAWRRSPADALVAVLTAAGRSGWPVKLMHQWLADADAHPEAVLEALRAGGPAP